MYKIKGLQGSGDSHLSTWGLSSMCLLRWFFFSPPPGASLWSAVCITQHPHCMCLYVFLHIQAQLSMQEFGKVDIHRRPEMRAPPRSVYPLGWLVSLPANHCRVCHLLHFMCLLYSSLSAPNTFLCVSSLLSTDTPVSSQKGKTALHQSPVEPHVFSDGCHVGVLLCVSVCVLNSC